MASCDYIYLLFFFLHLVLTEGNLLNIKTPMQNFKPEDWKWKLEKKCWNFLFVSPSGYVISSVYFDGFKCWNTIKIVRGYQPLRTYWNHVVYSYGSSFKSKRVSNDNGQITLSTQLTRPNRLVIHVFDAIPQFFRNLPLLSNWRGWERHHRTDMRGRLEI